MTNSPPTKEKIAPAPFLEVIDDPQPRSAAFNMAADESLLRHATGSSVLRIYRWAQPAVSFGYGGHWQEVRARHPGVDWMRRWTGGGMVEHGEDFTYSLVVPWGTDIFRLGPPRDSYAFIHRALARAMAAAGIVAEPGAEREDAGPASPDTDCFATPVPHDLLVAGRKVAGAAQRLTRLGFLHQGSVRAAGSPGWRERLAASLPHALADHVMPRQMTPAEDRVAEQLVGEKYGTREWLERR